MLEIRALTQADDLRSVGELYAESWKQHYAGILPQDYLERLTADRWSPMLHANPEAVTAAFEEGRLAGAAITGFARDEEREHYGEVIAIYLYPSATGKGVGRKLLEAAMERLGQEGCEGVCLWVMEPNRLAVGFYEHLGFHPSGRSQLEKYGGQTVRLLEYIRAL